VTPCSLVARYQTTRRYKKHVIFIKRGSVKREAEENMSTWWRGGDRVLERHIQILRNFDRFRMMTYVWLSLTRSVSLRAACIRSGQLILIFPYFYTFLCRLSYVHATFPTCKQPNTAWLQADTECRSGWLFMWCRVTHFSHISSLYIFLKFF